MFAKLKSTVFIDALKFELTAEPHSQFKAVLRDEAGCVQSSMEKMLVNNPHEMVWDGLNHLPYGIYTLELSQGEDELKMRMVKRI
jgi:hypothetical protein